MVFSWSRNPVYRSAHGLGRPFQPHYVLQVPSDPFLGHAIPSIDHLTNRMRLHLCVGVSFAFLMKDNMKANGWFQNTIIASRNILTRLVNPNCFRCIEFPPMYQKEVWEAIIDNFFVEGHTRCVKVSLGWGMPIHESTMRIFATALQRYGVEELMIDNCHHYDEFRDFIVALLGHGEAITLTKLVLRAETAMTGDVQILASIVPLLQLGQLGSDIQHIKLTNICNGAMSQFTSIFGSSITRKPNVQYFFLTLGGENEHVEHIPHHEAHPNRMRLRSQPVSEEVRLFHHHERLFLFPNPFFNLVLPDRFEDIFETRIIQRALTLWEYGARVFGTARLLLSYPSIEAKFSKEIEVAKAAFWHKICTSHFSSRFLPAIENAVGFIGNRREKIVRDRNDPRKMHASSLFNRQAKLFLKRRRLRAMRRRMLQRKSSRIILQLARHVVSNVVSDLGMDPSILGKRKHESMEPSQSKRMRKLSIRSYW